MKRASDGKTAIPALVVAALLVSAIVTFPLGCVPLDNPKTVDSREFDSLLIPQDDYFAMYHPKFFTVDEGGNIYQVLPGEDQLEVN